MAESCVLIEAGELKSGINVCRVYREIQFEIEHCSLTGGFCEFFSQNFHLYGFVCPTLHEPFVLCVRVSNRIVCAFQRTLEISFDFRKGLLYTTLIENEGGNACCSFHGCQGRLIRHRERETARL